MHIIKNKVLLIRRFSFSLTFLLVCILYVVDHLCNPITYISVRSLCILIISLGLTYLLLSYKNFKNYSCCVPLFLYFLMCIIQTFNTDRAIFTTDLFICYLVPVILLLLSCLPAHDDACFLQNALNYIELFMALITVTIDLLSFEKLQIGVAGGITVNQNYLGTFNSASILILLNLGIDIFLVKKNGGRKLFFLLFPLMIFLIYCMYLTTCRSGFLAVMVYVILFVMSLLPIIIKRNKNVLFGALILALIFFVLNFDSIIKYFDLDMFGKEGFLYHFLSGRDVIWFAAFPKLMKNSWLFGNGVYTMFDRSFDSMLYMYNDVTYSYITYCHNGILDLIYYCGLVGVILLITWLRCFFVRLKKINLKDIKNRCIIITLLSIAISLMFENIIIWGFTYWNLLFFIELGKLMLLTGADDD